MGLRAAVYHGTTTSTDPAVGVVVVAVVVNPN
jgi:hypothetical protein